MEEYSNYGASLPSSQFTITRRLSEREDSRL